jgi:NADH:ubiquinone reductase (H+-translocating)
MVIAFEFEAPVASRREGAMGCTGDVSRQRILILGGGFAAIYAAQRLERTMARNPHVEITIVNCDNYLLFTPMLHEVAGGELEAHCIVNPIRKLLRRVRFFCGDVRAVDLNRKSVRVTHGKSAHPHDLEYDQLVLALGSTTNFFGLEGVKERAFTMRTLDDAIRLRDHLIAQLDEADFDCASDSRPWLLTFVVAGGGFAGVETAGSVDDFLRDSLPFYQNLEPEMIRVVLVSSGPVILPELKESLGRYALRKLADRGIEVLTNARVQGATEQDVALSDGRRIVSNTLIWTAGTSIHPLLASLPCAKEHGRIVVDEFLEIPQWPGVFAVGDCAYLVDPKSGKPHPPTAQHAVREGKRLAGNLCAAINGMPLRPFRFKTLGQLATIGRRTGVANILGINFSGFIAWWLWRTIYLLKLPRVEKKIRVAFDWTLDLFFAKDMIRHHRLLPGDLRHAAAKSVDASADLETPATIGPRPTTRDRFSPDGL